MRRLECCNGLGVDDDEWEERHMQKCRNRLECVNCGEKTVWPGLKGRNQDRCIKCTIPSKYRDIDFDPERNF